jgi:hypothetical protein
MDILLTGTEKQQNKSYDSVFKIIESKSFLDFIKVETVSEKDTKDGYLITLNMKPCFDAVEKIKLLENVIVID